MFSATKSKRSLLIIAGTAAFTAVSASMPAFASGILRCESIFTDDFFASLSKQKKFPESLTENSAAQLFDSLSAIKDQYKIKTGTKDSERLVKKDREIRMNPSLPKFWKDPVSGTEVPLEPLWTLSAVIESLMPKLGLTDEQVQEISIRFHRITIEDMGLSWSEYLKFIKPHFNLTSRSLTAELMREITLGISRMVQVDRRFNIPYIAGYPQKFDLRIYVDRNYDHLKTTDIFKTDTIPFLVLHETLEKLLIDELQLSDRVYLRTHQMAQRFEKEAVEAAGLEWQAYQHVHIHRQIGPIEEAPITKSPNDLDKIPYRDYKDWETLDAMKDAEQSATLQSFQSLFTPKVFFPGVIHLHFNDQHTLASTMMRFQEFYESPQFKGVEGFSTEAYKKWYRSQSPSGKFDYYSEQDGFNVPSSMFEPFFKGKFNPLTKNEKALLEYMQYYRHTSVYIIATASDSGVNTLAHEVAHGLYFLNPAYKKEANQIMAKYDLSEVERYLMDTVGHYHKDVIPDELHAWLMHDTPWMKDNGFDVKPYEKITAELKALYLKYNPTYVQ